MRFITVASIVALSLVVWGCAGRGGRGGGGGGPRDTGPRGDSGPPVDTGPPPPPVDSGPCTSPLPERCNGLDDDCDDGIDEGFGDLGMPCTAGTGACERSGTIVCDATELATGCSAIPGTPGVETCDGSDEDCDGTPDDGVTQPCYSGPPGTMGVGACRSGTQTCSGGSFGACLGEVTPGVEICNAQDDDCNGTIDDGLGMITCGMGACMRSVPACSGGAPPPCVPGPPGVETCNAIDDDCDGLVDDGVCAVGGTFRITSMGSAGCLTAQHDPPSGDDRGGIAVSTSRLFITGDSATVRLDPATLAGVTAITPSSVHDGLFSDVSSGQAYVLLTATGTQPTGAATVTQLGVLDGTTGALTATRIALTTPIATQYSSGIFSGSGGALVGVPSGTRLYWWHIALPSGVVTTLGDTQVPTHAGCENWAWWGIAETYGGQHHAVYVESTTRIARLTIPNSGSTSNPPTTAGTFTNLGDMCSISFSATRNRWYAHFEYNNQFSADPGSESALSCPATWDTGGGGPGGTPRSCRGLPAGSPTGTYMIDPDGAGGGAPFTAYCDMVTAGGGWTLTYKVRNDYPRMPDWWTAVQNGTGTTFPTALSRPLGYFEGPTVSARATLTSGAGATEWRATTIRDSTSTVVFDARSSYAGSAARGLRCFASGCLTEPSSAGQSCSTAITDVTVMVNSIGGMVPAGSTGYVCDIGWATCSGCVDWIHVSNTASMGEDAREARFVGDDFIARTDTTTYFWIR